MVHTTNTAPETELRPPITRVGMIGWIRENLFNSPFNSLLTVICLYGFYRFFPPFFKWAFLESVWRTGGDECKTVGGACWSVVTENIRFIIFGFYPYEDHWRPLLAMIVLFGLLFISQNRRFWNRKLIVVWAAGIFTMGLLMKGGLFGLQSVDSSQWSGLPLTLLLSVFGLTAAYPLGVILALGRQSKLRAVKTLCILYIELIRGVPLISLLFMSSVIFPLFLPEGVSIDKILRAMVAIILFTAAYIAEVVRGGLQAIALGQFEAAKSLGLNYYQQMRLIVLPQALKIVIPPSVSILISAFKDTSLVVIIALFEILKTTQSRLSDPEWMGFSVEAYIFLAILYFLGCFSMSNYGRRLEKEMAYEH